MVILDGMALAQKILAEVKKDISRTGKKLRLGIVVVGKNPVIEKFIAQKKKTAAGIGIDTRVYPFEESVSTNELRGEVSKISHEEKNTGVIVQLPLPSHVATQSILNAVAPEKDVDMLSARSVGDFAVGKSDLFPPVAGAIKAFFEEYRIDYRNKHIVVLGAGVLVGRPVAHWLLYDKATFSVVRSNTPNPDEFLRRADIIISGIGMPKYITPDKVKDGVIVLDAGTSESEGKIAGDADFESLKIKASFITPVPGGIGPVTVAILMRNLLALAK